MKNKILASFILIFSLTFRPAFPVELFPAAFKKRVAARYDLIKKRAKEWYKKHKTEVKRAAAVGAVAAGAVYVLTRYLNRAMPFVWGSVKVGDVSCEGVERKLKNGIVLKQIKVDQQVGCTCGYHVVKNSMLILNMLPGYKGFLGDAAQYNREATEKIATGGEWRRFIQGRRREGHRTCVMSAVYRGFIKSIKKGLSKERLVLSDVPAQYRVMFETYGDSFKDKKIQRAIYYKWGNNSPKGIQESMKLVDKNFMNEHYPQLSLEGFNNLHSATDEQLKSIDLATGRKPEIVEKLYRDYKDEDKLEWTYSREVKDLLKHVFSSVTNIFSAETSWCCNEKNIRECHWNVDGHFDKSQEPSVGFVGHNGNHWIAVVRHTEKDSNGTVKTEYIIADSFNNNCFECDGVKMAINTFEGAGTI